MPSAATPWVTAPRSGEAILAALPAGFVRAGSVAHQTYGDGSVVTVELRERHPSTELRFVVDAPPGYTPEAVEDAALALLLDFTEQIGGLEAVLAAVPGDTIPVVATAESAALNRPADEAVDVLQRLLPPGRPTPFWTVTWDLSARSVTQVGVLVPGRDEEEVVLAIRPGGVGSAVLEARITQVTPLNALRNARQAQAELRSRARDVAAGYASQITAALRPEGLRI